MCKVCVLFHTSPVQAPLQPHTSPGPPRHCEACDELETPLNKHRMCSRCGWVFYCDAKCKNRDAGPHESFCDYAQDETLELPSTQLLPPCGIGTIHVEFAWHALQRMIRYQIRERGPTGATNVELPPRYGEKELRSVHRRLAGFPTYRTEGLRPELRQAPLATDERVTYRPSMVLSSFTATFVDCDVGRQDRKDEDAVGLVARQDGLRETILDSGCNRVLVHPTMNVKDMRQAPTTKLAGITDAPLKVTRQATACFQYISGRGGVSTTCFEDALVSESTPYNILSPVIMDYDLKQSVVFQNNQALVLRHPIIINERDVICRARMMPNKLYRLDGKQDKPLDINKRYKPTVTGREKGLVTFSVNPNATKAPIDAMTFHRMAAHAGVEAMEQLARQEGRTIKGKDWRAKLPTQCHPCLRAKSTRLPFYRDNKEVDSDFRLGESINIDFRGPWPVKSIQGNYYKLIIKERYGFTCNAYSSTRESTGYLKRIIKTINFIETQTGRRVKQIQTDGEFTSRLLKEYCDFKGIVLKPSSRDEPTSNPVAERDHRTSGGRATALRIDAGLPEAFWEEMNEAECAIRMITPLTKGKYKGRSPYEITLKRSFPTGFLQPIGCLAFVRLVDARKGRPMAIPVLL